MSVFNRPYILLRYISILLIIIFSFYIALNTSTMSLSALQIYYYPGHWTQCFPTHTVCTISTPWGAFQPGITWRSKTVWPTIRIFTLIISLKILLSRKCFLQAFISHLGNCCFRIRMHPYNSFNLNHFHDLQYLTLCITIVWKIKMLFISGSIASVYENIFLFFGQFVHVHWKKL